MTPSQAAELVTYLVAVFRPRDFGDASTTAYANSIQDFDYDDARRAVEWIAEHDRFFPALSRLRAEIADDYVAPPIETLERTALPGYAAVHALRPALVGAAPMRAGDSPLMFGPLADAVRHVTHREQDPHIDYDPEQVKRRKAEAKAAASAERKRIAAENGKAVAK